MIPLPGVSIGLDEISATSSVNSAIWKDEVMLKARSALELSVFTLLGVFAAYVMSSSHDATKVLLLMTGSVCFCVLLVAFSDPLTNALAALKSFTWWQGLWLFLFASGLVFRNRDIQTIEAEPLDAWAIFRICLVTVTGMVLLFRLALRRTFWLRPLFRGLIGFLATYSLVCLATSIWSVYPSWTFYKSAEYLVDVVLLAAIVATASSVVAYKRLFDWTWTLIGLLLLSVWLGLLFHQQEALLPTEGLLQVQLSGIVPDVHPNTVGELGAVVGLIAFTRLLRKSRSNHVSYGLLMTIALLTMCLAQSRSAILGFVLGIALILWFSGRRRVGLLLSADLLAEQVVDGVQGAVVPPLVEVAPDGALGREVLGEVAPLAARPQQVDDGIDDVAQGGRAGPATGVDRDQPLDQVPLLVCDVAGILIGSHPNDL